MINFAPVLIPTLNRYEHFRKCVESLSLCTNAINTDLFVFLDYPLKKTHWYGYEKIKAYLPIIHGFKSINIIEREKNFGVVDNFFKSVEYVLERSDKFIFSEDDNIFSPDFLDFVNRGLEVYKERKDILSIAGYQYPVTLPKNYKYDVYLYKGFSAWGYGTWKNKWEDINWDIDELKRFLNNKNESSTTLSKNLIKGLNRIIETGEIIGDRFICYYQTVNNIYSVFPVISRVRNNGHDGSGINGGNNPKVRDIYLNQPISDGTLNIDFPIDIMPDESVINSLRRQLNVPLIKKIIKNPDMIFKRTNDFIQKAFNTKKLKRL